MRITVQVTVDTQDVDAPARDARGWVRVGVTSVTPATSASLEPTHVSDHTEPVVREVFTLKRDALAVDLVGLHLAEAHELVTALQEVLVPAQISQALAQRRCCPHCGRAYRHKDTKKITLRTLFGTLDVNRGCSQDTDRSRHQPILNGDFRCSDGYGISVLGLDRSLNHESRHLIRAAETHSMIH